MGATTKNGFRNHSLSLIHSSNKHNLKNKTTQHYHNTHCPSFSLPFSHSYFCFSQANIKKRKEKMIGNFVDDIDCGSFFDDLLEFPDDAAADTSSVSPLPPASNFWPVESDSFPAAAAAYTVFPDNSVTDLSAELSVPYEEIVQLEWLSNFVEDSFSGGSLSMKKEEPQCTTQTQFQTASPISVLESTSFSSGEKAAAATTEIYVPVVSCGRARSKRARPAAFNPQAMMQLIISPAWCAGENTEHSKKKKKMKVNLSSSGDQKQNAASNSEQVRKCLHCEITKTPQWRTGPMGPKTLCNACGVRYKSGRLFPEYRPAASPSFSPAVHSNSHKKVLEIRNKTCFPNTTTTLSLG